jgi:hypothetical protein
VQVYSNAYIRIQGNIFENSTMQSVATQFIKVVAPNAVIDFKDNVISNGPLDNFCYLSAKEIRMHNNTFYSIYNTGNSKDEIYNMFYR